MSLWSNLEADLMGCMHMERRRDASHLCVQAISGVLHELRRGRLNAVHSLRAQSKIANTACFQLDAIPVMVCDVVRVLDQLQSLSSQSWKSARLG